MKNDFVQNFAIGQSGKPSVTVKAWDAREVCLRDCLIDAADLPVVQSVTGTWYAQRVRGTAGKWYAIAKTWIPGTGARTVLMHRLIMGLTDPLIEGDHKDNDGLNNQRYNLRECSHIENMRFRQPDRDWAALDLARCLADEYRIERGIAAAVQVRFDLCRQQLFHIRTGKTTGSPAAKAYRSACIGKCRDYQTMRSENPVGNRHWGAVLVNKAKTA